MKLKGKVVLVTGGSRGIGRAIVLGMAAEGATVVVNYLSAADKEAASSFVTVEDVVAAIEAVGGQALAIEADVADPNQVNTMVAQVIEHFEHIDILVNNAGIILRKPMLETTTEEWQRVFGVNIDGCFHCTQAVAPHMIERGHGGHIINLTSINSVRAIHDRACYAATQGAIDSFTQVCALELAPHRIMVNAVAPGVTNTDINTPLLTPEITNALSKRLPIGRVAQPEEIAQTVITIATGGLPYMTGQIVRVDGGWSSCEFDFSALQ